MASATCVLTPTYLSFRGVYIVQVIANGNVNTREDALKCLGEMASRCIPRKAEHICLFFVSPNTCTSNCAHTHGLRKPHIHKKACACVCPCKMCVLLYSCTNLFTHSQYIYIYIYIYTHTHSHTHTYTTQT